MGFGQLCLKQNIQINESNFSSLVSLLAERMVYLWCWEVITEKSLKDLNLLALRQLYLVDIL